MVHRQYWQRLIEQAWTRKSVVWLTGVRRVGKTFLAQSLSDVELFDCELPRVRRQIEDVESFLEGLDGRRIVLDEVHRLPNPSEVLKVAADHFPTVRLLATGSSTLGASARFRDTLTGRKETLWLTPMLEEDVEAFGSGDFDRRLLHGGLPPFFMADPIPERDFQEWLDSYWAKDILELFRLERRASFQRFAELLMTSSGGMFEATRFAAPCEVSRQTITNYLSVLEATSVVHVIRPFSSRRPTEIVSAPKVYAFDTGFVCYHKGWNQLRDDDKGPLWEHIVLNEMQGRLQRRDIGYWRNKRKLEVDFVLRTRPRATPVAIECKWSASSFDPSGIIAFRTQYPDGESYVVSRDVTQPFKRTYRGIGVRFVGLQGLIRALSRHP